MEQNNSQFTGGCQCGAVRFRAERLGRPTICHCRMCQKAFGGFFGPLVTAHGVTWTRAEPNWFWSSDKARRGFCGACGTPLAYHVPDEQDVELSIGAFDDPSVAAPVLQVNPKDKLSFFDELTHIPVRSPRDSVQQDKFNASVRNFQHPDHDTEVWPPPLGFPK